MTISFTVLMKREWGRLEVLYAWKWKVNGIEGGRWNNLQQLDFFSDNICKCQHSKSDFYMSFINFGCVGDSLLAVFTMYLKYKFADGYMKNGGMLYQ